MGRRKQRRRGLTAQLVEGQDDDLIAWLDKLPPGTRQQTIKNALRFGLDMPIPAPTGNNGADAQRFEKIEQVVTQLWQRVDTLGHLPAAALQSSEPAEAAPQMTGDEQVQRASKLKKASW